MFVFIVLICLIVSCILSNRALFDRTQHLKDELSFKKGDILYVTDTMYNGHMGCWRACLVNEEDAQRREIGMVPSRMKYERFSFLVSTQ